MMTQMRRDSCCLSSPYILPTPEPPCPLTSWQLCVPSPTTLPPVSTCSTRKANRPKFLSARRHTLSTALTFAYTSGTWTTVWRNSFPHTSPQAEQNGTQRWLFACIRLSCQGQLTSSIYYPSLWRTANASATFLGGKLWKMNFPTLKVYRDLNQLSGLLKEAPKNQPSWSTRNTFTS